MLRPKQYKLLGNTKLKFKFRWNKKIRSYKEGEYKVLLVEICLASELPIKLLYHTHHIKQFKIKNYTLSEMRDSFLTSLVLPRNLIGEYMSKNNGTTRSFVYTQRNK